MRCYQIARGPHRHCDDCGGALDGEYAMCVQDGSFTYVLCDACAESWVADDEDDDEYAVEEE